MALEFIPLRWDPLIRVFRVYPIMFNINFKQIMAFYDFFVKSKNLGFRALFRPYQKRDETEIDFEGPKWSK